MFVIYFCLASLVLLLVFIVSAWVAQYRYSRPGKKQGRPTEEKRICPNCGSDSGISEPNSGIYRVMPHVCRPER